MAKILLVDDDLSLLETLSEWLVGEHHVVDAVSSAQEARERLEQITYDVVVLDWRLPDGEGPKICQEFRANKGTAPVIMLTARADIADKEHGLDMGADDYLTKPFNPKELSARIRALLRRPHQVQDNVRKVGNFTLDPGSFRVTRDGKEIQLLPKEFALLEFFMRHPGQVFSLETLLDRLWSTDSEASPETVRVHLTRLRGKIDTEGSPSIIRTIHRVGYKLDLQ